MSAQLDMRSLEQVSKVQDLYKGNTFCTEIVHVFMLALLKHKSGVQRFLHVG